MADNNQKSFVLELQTIDKSFGEEHVLKKVDLKAYEGEFITILGSSGSGKTTILRIIAGFEEPDEGEVFLLGQNVRELAPEKRNVNTVFQNYALFPHMNVFDNVAYGLKIRGVDKAQIRSRVKELLELVQLSGFEKRMPNEMSGGCWMSLWERWISSCAARFSTN